ncbi:MAG: hypothetical protein E6J91_48235, partial [Deltaproteobacteria bacterium]
MPPATHRDRFGCDIAVRAYRITLEPDRATGVDHPERQRIGLLPRRRDGAKAAPPAVMQYRNRDVEPMMVDHGQAPVLRRRNHRRRRYPTSGRAASQQGSRCNQNGRQTHGLRLAPATPTVKLLWNPLRGSPTAVRIRMGTIIPEAAWIRFPFAAFFTSSATSSSPVDVVGRTDARRRDALFDVILVRLNKRGDPMKDLCVQFSRWAVLVAAVLAVPAIASAQQGTISGTVTDQTSGQPISGAKVGVVGTTFLTQTNAEGRYTLSRIPAGTVTLRVSAIGYAAATPSVAVADGQTTTHDVGLKLQPYSLDEIVVTATGEQAKREVANAVSTVSAATVVQNGPIANMNDLLGARVPGVEVLPSAITGGGARVRIRGTNSLSLSNEPIYYIDGIRMESSVNSSSIGIGGTNPSRVNDINPDEIESYDVVKGPSASTLYGTDAANGVIVITTKRGRAGKPSWTLYNEMGIIRDYNQYPIAYRGWTTGSLPTNGTQCFLTNTVRAVGDPLRCVQDSVTQFNLFADKDATPNGTGWRGQSGLQVSGGSDVARYFIAGEFEKELGVLRMPPFAYQRVVTARQIGEVPYEQYRPNALQRASVRANIQATLNQNLDVAVSTGFISSTQRLPQTDNNTTGLLSNAFGGPGNKDNGRFGYRLYTPDQFFSETVRQDINRFIGSITSNWRPRSWLSSRLTGGVDYTGREDSDLCRRDQCTTFAGSLGASTLGYKQDNRTGFFSYTLEANAAASYGLTPVVRGKTTIGLQFFQNRFARNGAFGGYELPPGATTVSAGSILQADEATTIAKTLGAFIEEQFTFRERLYVTAALRGDDNSAFGKNFRAVYYPKFGVSWVVSEEPFFPTLSWLSDLRVRGALGASGTQPGSTDAIPFYSPATASVDGVDRGSIIFSAIGNETLKPERAREVELGFESSLFTTRVHLEF